MIVSDPHLITSDEELARSVQGGSREEFGVLVERYEKKLLRYGRKFIADASDVEDLVQDVFIRAYQNIQSFDTAQRFSPWIYRIAHNAFVNGLRKHAHAPLFSIDMDTFVSPIGIHDVETEHDQDVMKKAIDEGLSKVPVKYREVLILYYLEELSYKEISDVLKVPTGTVGIRLARGKNALKKFLSPDLLP